MKTSYEVYGSNRALTTAQLIVINALEYQIDKDKELSRYRFSLETFLKLSNRKRLNAQFINEVDENLAEMGWILLRLSSDYAVIRMTVPETKWTKLTTKRVEEIITMGEAAINQKFEELLASEKDFSDEKAD